MTSVSQWQGKNSGAPPKAQKLVWYILTNVGALVALVHIVQKRRLTRPCSSHQARRIHKSERRNHEGTIVVHPAKRSAYNEKTKRRKTYPRNQQLQSMSLFAFVFCSISCLWSTIFMIDSEIHDELSDPWYLLERITVEQLEADRGRLLWCHARLTGKSFLVGRGYYFQSVLFTPDLLY